MHLKSNKTLVFVILLLCSTAFLLPNFYSNKWSAVEDAYYEGWQIRYDRLVIARLVKTRQDGFFSAGGLLGLGNTTAWSYRSTVNNHQFDTYVDNGIFESYLIYKSNPGFQGVLYGMIDKLLNMPGEVKIRIFRGITATASALTFGSIFILITMEFGFLAGLFMLVFSAFSIWTVLPAGNIFWNIWVFYLPTFASIYLFSKHQQRGERANKWLYVLLCLTVTGKILLSGFDLMTTVLIMATVPILYFAIRDKWGWKDFFNRIFATGTALTIGTTIGLLIMGMQIASVEEQASGSYTYIISRVGKHLAGNTEYYADSNIEATKVGIVELLTKYMQVPAFNIRLPGPDVQILYWQVIFVFAFITLLIFIANRKQYTFSRKVISLISATWYSIFAPLSWILIFRPHSIIHPHVNSMGWQMPFTLLGFALCGYVITDLFRRTD